MSPISGVTWPDTVPTSALVRGPQSPIDARSDTERGWWSVDDPRPNVLDRLVGEPGHPVRQVRGIGGVPVDLGGGTVDGGHVVDALLHVTTCTR